MINISFCWIYEFVSKARVHPAADDQSGEDRETAAYVHTPATDLVILAADELVPAAESSAPVAVANDRTEAAVHELAAEKKHDKNLKRLVRYVRTRAHEVNIINRFLYYDFSSLVSYLQIAMAQQIGRSQDELVCTAEVCRLASTTLTHYRLFQCLLRRL